MDCLDEVTIAALLGGELGPPDEEAAKAHLAECDICREVVAETARSMGDDARSDVCLPLSRGNSIGRYTILDVIGAGGMGVVYAAYDPQLDRKVAVKLLRHDISTSAASVGDLGKRLLREAQVMAKLTHPNVVRVYDAGATQAGEVFIAMEFVPGQSLATWLAAEPRRWREVLDKYTQAGRGLAAAHAAGLVHRDFKPDNVLIGDDGRVLVTDFGLARIVGRGAESGSMPSLSREGSRARARSENATEVGVLAGTPAYMSPEQLLGQSATPLTDQYSFCVALYEGLFRQKPYSATTLDELTVERAGANPLPPPDGSPVPARVRAAVLRGMDKDPARRHVSMDELLLAMAPRQMKRRVIALLGVVGAVLAAILGYRNAPQVGLCSGSQARLSGVWDNARKAEIRASFQQSGRAYADDAWLGVEKTIDAYADGWAAMRTDACMATRVRGEQSEEMLDRRVECLDGHLRQLAALTRIFTEADGEVVARAVAASQTLPSLADCANTTALKAGVRPPADARSAERVQNARIDLARARAFDEAGKYDEARLFLEPVAAEARAIGYLPLEAEAQLLDGRIAGRVGDTHRAEESLRAAVESALSSGYDAIAVRAFIDLVYYVGHRQARYDDARQWARYAELGIARLGGNDELEADRLEALSVIAWRQGKIDEARSLLERAQSLYTRALGADHVKLARVLDGIAGVEFERGHLGEAFDLDEQAERIAERVHGPNHPALVLFLNNMANELASAGRYVEARHHLERAIAIGESSSGADSDTLVAPLVTLGSIVRQMGDAEGDVERVRRAKGILERRGQQGTPEYGEVLDELASAEGAAGELRASLDHASAAVMIFERLVGGDAVGTATLRLHLGEAHARLGDYKSALAHEVRALEDLTKARGPDARVVGQALSAMGRAETARGEPGRSVPLLARAVHVFEHTPGDPVELAEARFELARALSGAGMEASRARALAEEARGALDGPPWLAKKRAEIDAWLRDTADQKRAAGAAARRNPEAPAAAQ